MRVTRNRYGHERVDMFQPMRSRLVGRAALALVVVLMVRMASLGAYPITNADTWFHLRVGRDLGAPWTWSSVDSASSFATAPWVPTQALSDKVMWVAATHGGLSTLTLL